MNKEGMIDSHLPNYNLTISQNGYFLCFLSLLFASVATYITMDSLDDLSNGAPRPGELGLGGRFQIVGDIGIFKYPFRLEKSSLAAKIIPWICYVIHQTGIWIILFRAQKSKYAGEITWTDARHWNPYATSMLLWNALFIIIHFVESMLMYESLAATLPEMSVLLAGLSTTVIPTLFELRRRGLIIGWVPKGSFGDFLKDISSFARLYHGYPISFGLCLLFWFHPFEATWTHWSGFSHVFLLFFQSSLVYQKQHLNRYWTTLLEVWFVLHGTIMAFFHGNMDGLLWIIYLTSFFLLFVVCYMWGLPCVQKYLFSNPHNSCFRYYSLLVSALGFVSLISYLSFYAANAPEKTFLIMSNVLLHYGLLFWISGFLSLANYINKIFRESNLRSASETPNTSMAILAACSMISIMILCDITINFYTRRKLRILR